MEHDQIVSYVAGMKQQDLTPASFDEFVSMAREIFEPQGTTLLCHSRKGKNSATLEDFADGKAPAWNEFDKYVSPTLLTVTNFCVKPNEDPQRRRFLVVYLKEATGHEVFGTNRALPLKFAFDRGKALYVAQHSENGTPEHPYEDLYVRN